MTFKLFFYKLLRHIAIVLITIIGMVSFFNLTLNISFLNPIARSLEDFYISDVFYEIENDFTAPDTSQIITIVDMSELYRRRDIAQCIKKIERFSPKVLGVDILFENYKEDVVGDEQLCEAVAQNEKMVFAFEIPDALESNPTADEIHSFFTNSIPVTEGFINLKRNRYGGTKRYVTIGMSSEKKQRFSFPAAVANMYVGRELVKYEEKDIPINYSHTVFKHIPYDSINYYTNYIKDRIVLLGATADRTDIHYTPIGKRAGVEVLAFSIDSLLQNEKKKEPSGWLLMLITFVFVFLAQVVQDGYVRRIKNMKHEILRDLLGSSFVIMVLTFVLMTLLVWFAYFLFIKANLSINLGLTLSSIAIIGTVRMFYDIIIKGLSKVKLPKLTKQKK